jgi:thiamine biosynthesis protein ThiS
MVMEIKVNGEKRDLDLPMTVAELVIRLGLDPRSVVVERNLKIVPSKKMDATLVSEGDSIEIVRLVGGG